MDRILRTVLRLIGGRLLALGRVEINGIRIGRQVVSIEIRVLKSEG